MIISVHTKKKIVQLPMVSEVIMIGVPIVTENIAMNVDIVVRHGFLIELNTVAATKSGIT